MKIREPTLRQEEVVIQRLVAQPEGDEAKEGQQHTATQKTQCSSKTTLLPVVTYLYGLERSLMGKGKESFNKNISKRWIMDG